MSDKNVVKMAKMIKMVVGMEKFILEIKMQQISLYIPEHANLKLGTFLNMEDFLMILLCMII